eukprot:scaffold217182_cov24-Prasinocladus_malaysianus.AAC.1
MDFSDLEQKIMPFVGPDSSAGPARAARSVQLLQKYSTMEQLAEDFDQLLREVSSRTVAIDPRGCHYSAYWMYSPEGKRLPPSQILEIAEKRIAHNVPFYATDAKHHYLSERQLEEQFAAALEQLAADQVAPDFHDVLTG